MEFVANFEEKKDCSVCGEEIDISQWRINLSKGLKEGQWNWFCGKVAITVAVWTVGKKQSWVKDGTKQMTQIMSAKCQARSLNLIL